MKQMKWGIPVLIAFLSCNSNPRPSKDSFTLKGNIGSTRMLTLEILPGNWGFPIFAYSGKEEDIDNKLKEIFGS